MSLQNQEGTYSQAINNRMNAAVPQNIAALTPSGDAFEESVLYIDADDTLSIETATGATASVFFSAGWIPVRVVKVTAQAGSANIYRAW
jgi:hypothetical protein